MPAPVDIHALPLILYDEDLCRVLDISRTTLRKLRKNGAFPIPTLPALDKRKRYARGDVERYVTRETVGFPMARKRA